ncbi:hypothetical protein J1N09_05150 [Aureitalea sp. L0-47]|uniref:hypothetical protein n=1 Tax=Aureitalea sp. L0-47 TaxID=2816962 RepID=UPI002237B6AF|nr:hypothetical protein [Aureitalea sp. L0-47]MCW5519214.1 hypothetical protein [Aureitalea sp. L0-47]
MEEQSKREDQILKKLIVEAGTESPSHDFKAKLMDAVREKADQKVVYKPLIPGKVWIVVAAVFIGVAVIAVLFPSSGMLSSFGLDTSIVETGISIPKPEFSKTFIYAMIFLSLFLFQVPFLKKYVEAKYRID